ncbi:MAG: apolipoprotein A1/A4/E family protein [Synergistaceae bacterium]|nr:apolipoprotein A1/A4/E family protein [Synergistaceae bacterium]
MSLALTRKSRVSAPVFIREPYSPESDFIRKDTLDAHMKRIETLISLNMAEQRAMYERLEAKIDNVRTELKGDLKAMDERHSADLKAMDERHSGDLKAMDERHSGDLKAMDERYSGELKAMDERLTGKIEALDERLTGKIEALDERLTGKIKALDERLDHAVDTLTVAINAVDARVDGLEKQFNKRFDDMGQTQNKWFMLLGILVAVVPIAVALIQGAMAK